MEPFGVILIVLIGAALLAVGLLVGFRQGVRKAALLTEAALRREDEIERLAGIGRAILGVQLKLDALCEVVYQQSTRLVNTHNFQLGLFDGDDYTVKVWIRNGERLPANRFAGRAAEGLIGYVRKSATGLLIGDYERDWDLLPAKPTYESQDPPRSALFAPLIATGDVIGVIAVQSDTPDAFNAENLRMLTVLANQAAGAIRNAQLFEQTRERARQLRLINQITQEITAVQPVPDLLHQSVNTIQRAFEFYVVNLFIYDPVSNLVRLGASSSPAYEALHLSLMPGQGMTGTAFSTRQIINAPDVTKNPNYIASFGLDDTVSEICVPLRIEERVLGILDVQSDRRNAFNADTEIALESLAGQLALAMQESRTYDAGRRQAERVNALADASRAVVSILNLDDLLDEVVDLVTDYFGYDRVHLFLRSGDRVAFRAGSGVHSGRWALDRLSYHLDDNGFIPCVARNGQPLVSGEVFTDVHYVPGPGVEDSRSEMTVPIRIANRILGVFDIQSTQPDAFNAEDLRLMQALADTVAVGLRNASLFAAETRRRILAETLREVSLVIASSLDLESVLDGILQGLERVVAFEAALIALIEGKHYTVSAIRAQHATANVQDMKLEVGPSVESAIFDLLHRMEAQDTPREATAHDHLAVPLTVAGEQIGYMAIDRTGPDRFSPEEVEIINTFAGQAAVAISNALLYMSQREEAWVSSALLKVAEATGRATTLDEVLETVARITPELVGVEWCAVFLSSATDFRIVEIEGVTDVEARALCGYVFHDGDWPPLVQLRADGRPIVLTRENPLPPQVPFDSSRVGRAVLLPLYAKGEITGAMLIGQRTGTEPLSDRKIELVSGIANQAALAIESAQAFTAQQEEQWVTTALLNVAEAINTASSLRDTLDTLVSLIRMLVGTGFCAVLEWDAERRAFTGGAVTGLAADAEQQFLELVIPAVSDSFILRMTTSQEPLSAGQGMEYAVPQPLWVFNADAILVLPLNAKGALVGAMIVDHPNLAGAEDFRRINILVGTAQQAALAIEAAHLQADSLVRQAMDRELEVAQGIQQSFLPQQLPALPGWELAVFYRSARQVGGDFYDFIPLKSGKWGVVIADVADKGVPAALFMVLSRTNLRAAAFSRELPAETLARMNELLISDSRSEMFVTVWYGVFDPITGEMLYANAGHNPPLLLRANGKVEELSAHGIALGVINPVELEAKRVVLEKGDSLLAYTDGVTEALSRSGAEYGVPAMQRSAAAAYQQPASQMLGHIVHEVDAFTSGEPQFDDLTLIILKRQERTPPLNPERLPVDAQKTS